MNVVIKSITGRKWHTLDELSESETLCLAHFGLPLGVDDKTTACLNGIPSYDVHGSIDFYFVSDSNPSQFDGVLGAPIVFDILIITE